MNIIAISGKKHSGKDTFCKMLMMASRLPSVRVAFADALKLECANICQESVAEIEEKKEHYRPLLQWWGQHQRMVKGEDYWIRQALLTINNTPYVRGQLFIISDMRMMNEYNIMKELSAHTVRMARPLKGVDIDQHISETELDSEHNFNSIILNSGTLQHLHEQAIELLTKLKLPIKS